MAFKRLVGVVTVKDGQVVKSYGYRFWRPAGGLRTALMNLDRWLVDEILVLDISGRSHVDSGVIQQIRASRISTPLIYGGGIRTVDDVDRLLASGCERFLLETMLFQFPDRVTELADKVGQQALIASLPLCRVRGEWHFAPEYAKQLGTPTTDCGCDSICRSCNTWPVAEVLAIDRDHDGQSGGFALVNADGSHPLSKLRKGIIWFGGVSDRQAAMLLRLPATVAVGFGNVNCEREIFMREVRSAVLRQSSEITVRSVSQS
jgi:cyclase